MKKNKKKDSQPKEEKQLDLGIKEPFKNRFYKLKGKTDKAVQRLEVRRYLQDPLTWGVIIISLFLIATQGYLIYTNWDKFPTLIPIFKYQLLNAQKLADSEYVLIYPALSLMALIFTIIVTGKFYSREKYLVKFLLVSTFLSSFSLTVILIDLIKNI
jgi:hypothetical protein